MEMVQKRLGGSVQIWVGEEAICLRQTSRRRLETVFIWASNLGYPGGKRAGLCSWCQFVCNLFNMCMIVTNFASRFALGGGGEGNTPKIFEEKQILKKSILQRWYTHNSISHAHGNNIKAIISPGDAHTAKVAKFH